MKVTYVSDLHIEFGPMIQDMTGETLVIAGDTCPIYKKSIFEPFLQEVSDNFHDVVMVAGNHEFYDGNLLEIKDLYDMTRRFGNIHVLDDDFIVLDNVVFIGGTLWSDIDPLWSKEIERGMNDFICIRRNNRRFKPLDATNLHYKTYTYLEHMLTRFDPKHSNIVVVTHHAPSLKSISKEYETSCYNSAYASNLEFMMEGEFAPKYWIHGHVHHSLDYMVGNTNVLCNPRGYVKYGENKNFDAFKTFEI